MRYFNRNLSALSQTLNVALLNGEPNESISGRAYRTPWPRAMRVIDALFFWQDRHCRGAYAVDLKWARTYVIENEYRTLRARYPG